MNNLNTMPSIGCHRGKLVKQGENLVEDRFNKNNKHYLSMMFVDSETGETLEPRLYDGFLSVFFTQIWKQTRGATGGLKASEVFQYLSEHEFCIWVSLDEEYDWPQYAFQAPKA